MLNNHIIKIVGIISFLLFILYYNYSNLEFKKQMVSITNELESFKAKGKRFTASNGQDLCNELQAMQLRVEGKISTTCNYEN